MKKLISSIILGSILMFSVVVAVMGALLMTDSFFNHGASGMKGFQMFCLGTILFVVILSGYMLSRILSYTEVIVDTLTTLVEHTLNKAQTSQSLNPLQALFGNLGLPGSGTIKMATLDEDGKVVPFMEKEFNNHEEFIKHRDELLSKAFSGNNKKKVEDMTLEELQEEEKKAVSIQNFELAACIRDAINEKTKKKE